MKKQNWKKVMSAGLLATVMILESCGGGNGPGGVFVPGVTAQQFVNALNDFDGVPIGGGESRVILRTDETYRGGFAGEDEWFVIYDALHDQNKAVSLQYLRSIVYFDYYSDAYAVADEFRAIERDDILDGYGDGDSLGDDYEVVDYNSYTGYFEGRNSDWDYEDEAETMDVALMAGEKEKMAFFKKASQVSFAFSVSIEAAMSLVTLGSKVEKMLGKSQGELTEEDQKALMGDFQNLSGVTLEEVIEAAVDDEKKEAMISKIADKIGTTAENLEARILPKVFGLELQ